jgi:hypothetical protein
LSCEQKRIQKLSVNSVKFAFSKWYLFSISIFHAIFVVYLKFNLGILYIYIYIYIYI